MINNAFLRVFGDAQKRYGDKPMDAMGLLSVVLCRILQSHAVVSQPPIWSDTPYKLPVRRMNNTLAIDKIFWVPRNFLKLT